MTTVTFEQFGELWEAFLNKYGVFNSTDLDITKPIALGDEETLSLDDLQKIKQKYLDPRKNGSSSNTVKLPRSIYFKLFSFLGIENFGDLGQTIVPDADEPDEDDLEETDKKPLEIKFIGREKELDELKIFADSKRKRIFCLYGVPMIGKSWLIEQFCIREKDVSLKEYATIKTIKFNPNPENYEEVLKEKLFPDAEMNDFSVFSDKTLIIIQNFEEVLDWKGGNDQLHKIKVKYLAIREFIKKVASSELVKVILESRFQIEFGLILENESRTVQYLEGEKTLKGINYEKFWEYYEDYYTKNGYTEEQFKKLGKEWNNHTGLLAITTNENIKLVQSNGSTTGDSQKITERLWDVLTKIINKLDRNEILILCLICLIKKPLSEEELIEGVNQIPNQSINVDIKDHLDSLSKKLLTNTLSGDYDLNPYIKEVCYTHLEKSQALRMYQIKKTAFYEKYGQSHLFSKERQYYERGDYNALFKLGRSQKKEGAYERALEIFDMALDIHPERYKIFTEIAVIYRKKEKYDEALAKLNRGLLYKPDDKYILNEIGIIYKLKGNIEEAEKRFKELVYEKDHLSSYNELSMIYRDKDDYAGSIEVLELALSKKEYENDGTTLNEAGISYLHEELYDKAEEVLLRAIANKNNESYSVLCRVYRQTGQLDAALKKAEEGLRKNGWDKKALRNELQHIKKQIARSNMKRDKIFISYAHKDDSEILEKVRTNLIVLKQEGYNINLWDDSQIKAGMIWKREIEKALATSKIAILLISTNFLASDFIMNNELPSLLKSQKKQGLTILPLIIQPCRYSTNKKLNMFQSVNDPNRPLSRLKESEKDDILLELMDRIVELL